MKEDKLLKNIIIVLVAIISIPISIIVVTFPPLRDIFLSAIYTISIFGGYALIFFIIPAFLLISIFKR
jgi:uncharacterized membrane protein